MQQRIAFFITQLAVLNRIFRSNFLRITNSNTIQPGTKPPARVVRIKIAVRSDERVLQRVFGVGMTRATGYQET